MFGKFWFKLWPVPSLIDASPNGWGHAEVCEGRKWSGCLVTYQPQSRTPSGDRPSEYNRCKNCKPKENAWSNMSNKFKQNQSNHVSCEPFWLLPISCLNFLVSADSTSHRIWSPTIPPMNACASEGRGAGVHGPALTYMQCYICIHMSMFMVLK